MRLTPFLVQLLQSIQSSRRPIRSRIVHVNTVTAHVESLEDRKVCSAEMVASAYVLGGVEHVVFRGDDGHVQERWFDGKWNTNDLTVAAGMPVAAASSPVGYTTSDQQHVIYRGTDNRIHELRWTSSTGWKHFNVSGSAGVSANVASNPTAYVGANGTQHLIYRGTDSRIHELYLQSGRTAWRHSDLTTDSSAPANVASDPSSYVEGTTQHIVYRGSNNHIYELHGGTGWGFTDLTVASGVPLAASAPSGYTHGAQVVVFRSADNRLYAIWGSPGSWHYTDLTADAQQPANATSDPAGYSDGVAQSVVYRSNDGHIRQLWWAGAGWNHVDLTASVSGTSLSSSAPSGTSVDNKSFLTYRGTDGRIHELRFTYSTGWVDTALTGEPPRSRTPGFIVTPTSGLVTTEAGGSASFTVSLKDQPTANVVIAVGSTNIAEGIASVSQLVFTPTNWNQAQTVNVRGVDDNLDDGDQAYAISLAPATSADSSYNGLNPDDPQLRNIDNDAPSQSPIATRVTYADAAGEGFNDPTLGAARRRALEYALGIWSSQLTSAYSGETITVIATMDPLGGSASSAILAGANATTIHRNFAGGLADTWYGAALANHLAGHDLDTTLPEIGITFNSDVDNPTVLGPNGFYYGTDGRTGSNIDFISVALHEVGHGLDFSSLIDQSGNYEYSNRPGIWDRQLEIGNGTDLTAMTASQRAQALVSNDLFWNGTQGIAGDAGQRPKIYASNPYQPGSSSSHLDEGVHGSELLSPIYSGVDHEPSRMELGMLVDMGWNVRGLASPASVDSVVLGTAASVTNLQHSTFVANTNSLLKELRVSDVQIAEGNAGTKTVKVTVQLSQPATESVRFKYRTANGSALSGMDFTAKTGEATILRGQSRVEISLTVKGDNTVEADESFMLVIFEETKATIADNTGIVTILNDDRVSAQSKAVIPTVPQALATSRTATVLVAPFSKSSPAILDGENGGRTGDQISSSQSVAASFTAKAGQPSTNTSFNDALFTNFAAETRLQLM